MNARYKAGRKHSDPDALSCGALLNSEDSLLSHEDILGLAPYDASSFILEELKDPLSAALIRHLDGTAPSTEKVHSEGASFCSGAKRVAQKHNKKKLQSRWCSAASRDSFTRPA